MTCEYIKYLPGFSCGQIPSSRRRVPAVRELGTRIQAEPRGIRPAVATLLSTFPLLLPLEAQCWINNVQTVVCACCASAGASPRVVSCNPPELGAISMYLVMLCYQVVIYPVFLGLVYGVVSIIWIGVPQSLVSEPNCL